MAAKDMSPAELEMVEHCRCGHRTKLKLQKRPCHGCVIASTRAPAGYKGWGTKDRALNAIGADTIEYGQEDINGHRYGSHWVLLKTHFSRLIMLKNKTVAATARAYSDVKADIEALVDPGGLKGYKIQRVGRDPGSEFLGEFLDAAAEDSIPRETGEVDIHHCQAIQENRHKMTHRAATAMTATSMRTQELGNLVHGNAAVWATELVNHSAITKEQKDN